MSEPMIWWVMAGVAVAAELLSGTFYLLMIAVGLSAGALAAHAGASTTWQLVAAAVVGAVALLVWYFWRKAHPKDAPAEANRDVNLDVGETVHVERWQPDGTSQVRYRGAQWAVESADGATSLTGPHRVVRVEGNRLVVQKITANAS